MEGVSGAFRSVLADLDDIIAKSNKAWSGVGGGQSKPWPVVLVFRGPVSVKRRFCALQRKPS